MMKCLYFLILLYHCKYSFPKLNIEINNEKIKDKTLTNLRENIITIMKKKLTYREKNLNKEESYTESLKEIDINNLNENAKEILDFIKEYIQENKNKLELEDFQFDKLISIKYKINFGFYYNFLINYRSYNLNRVIFVIAKKNIDNSNEIIEIQKNLKILMK